MEFFTGFFTELFCWGVGFYVAFVPVPASITAINDDNHHQEYRFNGSIGDQKVEYKEDNFDEWSNLRYQGVLSVRNKEVSGYAIRDGNNNLRLDNGDTITIRGTDGKEVRFKIDTSNQNIAELVRGLQPKMDSTLAAILAANTAAVR